MNQPNLDDLKSAAGVALGFMSLGVQAIERKFGESYALQHPELVGAFMLAAALVFERKPDDQ